MLSLIKKFWSWRKVQSLQIGCHIIWDIRSKFNLIWTPVSKSIQSEDDLLGLWKSTSLFFSFIFCSCLTHILFITSASSSLYCGHFKVSLCNYHSVSITFPYQKVVFCELNSPASWFKTLFGIVDSVLHMLYMKCIQDSQVQRIVQIFRQNGLQICLLWNDSNDKFTYAALVRNRLQIFTWFNRKLLPMSLRVQPFSFEFWSLFPYLYSEIGCPEWGLSPSYSVFQGRYQNTPQNSPRLFPVAPFAIH